MLNILANAIMIVFVLGEAASVASGVAVPQSDTLSVEMMLQAREQINNIMERYALI